MVENEPKWELVKCACGNEEYEIYSYIGNLGFFSFPDRISLKLKCKKCGAEEEISLKYKKTEPKKA